MRVFGGGAPVRARLVAVVVEVHDESRQTRVLRIEVHQRENREGCGLDVLHRQRGGELHGAHTVSAPHERAGETGSIEHGELRAAVIPVQLAVGVRRAGERQVVAGVYARRGVRGHRPRAQESLHAPERLRGHLESGGLGLQKELRGPKRHDTVPRRIGAVRPHREIVRVDHRHHSADASIHGLLRIGSRGRLVHGQRIQHAAGRDEREDLRHRLLQTAIRIGGEIL